MEERERTDVTIRFGVFEVDPRSGELRKAGVRIRVQDQPYKVLLALLERPGEVVSREELKTRIWPKESFGDFDHAVNVAVGKLRTALGDSAVVPRYVETLHRRGYRFVFPVEPGGGQKSVGAEESTKVVASESQGRGRAWIWTTAGLLTIVALGVAGFLVYGGRPKLTDKSRIVLGDFANTTGDAVFDGALRQGLEVQLEQSPFLSLLSRTEMEQTLQMMKQPADAKLTLAIAREICERTQSAVVLDGSIAQIGTRYILIVKAVNCANGETLASTEAEASDKNQVLESLGKASSEIRRKLGESLASVKKYDTPLEHATTSSLDALKAYDLGYQAGENGDYAAAIPFFERATALDSKFGMAYTLLGMMQGNLHNDPRALENLKRGFELRAARSCGVGDGLYRAGQVCGSASGVGSGGVQRTGLFRTPEGAIPVGIPGERRNREGRAGQIRNGKGRSRRRFIEPGSGHGGVLWASKKGSGAHTTGDRLSATRKRRRQRDYVRERWRRDRSAVRESGRDSEASHVGDEATARRQRGVLDRAAVRDSGRRDACGTVVQKGGKLQRSGLA